MAYDQSALFAGGYRKYLPSLVGAGVGAIAGAISAGRKAYQAQQVDSRTKFDTWSERPRPMLRMKRRLPTRRSYARRSRRYVPRRPGKVSYTWMVRSTQPSTVSVAAAAFAVATRTPKLNDVYTTDLLAAYKVYRIRKVVLHLVPRIDVANSGIANNFQFMVAACNDPEDTSNPTNVTDVTAYENSFVKWVKSGDEFTYTFYPKVVNAVGNSGATAYQGSYGLNPWLLMNATGVAIPHNCLKLAVQAGSGTTVTFDYFLDIHFEVKGQSA